MFKRHLATALMTGAVSLAMVSGVALAQNTTASRANYKAPRTAWGAPDLSGAFTNSTVTPLQRNTATYGERLVMTPEELAKVEAAELAYQQEGNQPTNPSFTINDLPVNCGRGFSGANCGYNRGWTDPGTTVMRVNGQPRTSFITTTPNGRIPPTKSAEAQALARRAAAEEAEGEGGDAGPPAAGRAAAAAAAAGRGGGGRGGAAGGAGRPGPLDNVESRSLGERCIMSFGQSSGPIMQPQLYNNNYMFAQSKDSLAIWVEMVHDVRIIRIGEKHRTDGVRPYMGDSIGWWEGETLVAETTNFHPRQSLGGSSANLKVTERFTRVAPDRILYQFKVEDPTVWDQPWGGEYEFGRIDGQVYEYACHEGNYALEGILAGARAEEAALAAGATSAPAAAR